MLDTLPPQCHPAVIVGCNQADDSGVVRLSADTALVLTLDFFPAIVDDPYTFGQVAAANALSDVYAMGGKPLTALNIVGFPEGELPLEALADLLRGGADKVNEAGAVVVGGHTIRDSELKYGLSVVGLIHPDRILLKEGARNGDVLILTKPIGTGIYSTALKNGALTGRQEKLFYRVMSQLNRNAAEGMYDFGVRACTDITGFGLLGHALEMALASDVSLVFNRPRHSPSSGRPEAVLGRVSHGGRNVEPGVRQGRDRRRGTPLSGARDAPLRSADFGRAARRDSAEEGRALPRRVEAARRGFRRDSR